MSKKNRSKTIQIKRSAQTPETYEEWYGGSANSSYIGGRYGYMGTGSDKTGIYDYRIPPQMLAYVVQDPIIFGMIRIIIANIFKNSWQFLGNPRKVKLYTETLKTLEWDEAAEAIILAWIGAGGGNALVLFEKNGKISINNITYEKLKLRVEPFLAEGKYRVKVYPDYNQRQNFKYEIINYNLTTIQTLDADQVIHARYLDADGDFRFSNSPAIVAARPVNLAFEGMVASETVYTNGMNFNKSISPDFSSAKDVEMFKVMDGNWDKFVAVLESTRGVRNRNKDLVGKVPLKVDKIGTNNVDMQTIALIQECEKLMQAAYGVALSNLGFTESANYSTSEQNRENVSELNTNWLTKKLEKLVMNEIMPRMFPDYDPTSEPFKQNYDPSQEDIQIRSQNIATFNTYLAAEASQPGVFDISDDLLNSIGITKKTKFEEKVNEQESLENSKNQIQKSEENRSLGLFGRAAESSKKKLTYSEQAWLSPEFNKFQNKLQLAFKKQLEKFVSKLKTSEKPETVILPKLETFYSFPVLKKDLTVFSKIMLETMNAKYKKNVQIRADVKSNVFGKFPDSVGEFLDQEAQRLLKGEKEYAGLDGETAAQINQIIADNLSLGSTGIAKLIADQIDEITLERAETIAKTETARAIEITQFILAKNDFGLEYKEWITGTFEVCPICLDNENQGRIAIDRDFDGGVSCPPQHPNCGCTALYYTSIDSDY